MQANAEDTNRGGNEHYRLRFQNLSFRGKTLADPSMKVAPSLVFHQSTHGLPYFAHQQLDPNYFPLGKSALKFCEVSKNCFFGSNCSQLSVGQLVVRY
jgi:hypothetical protein